MVRLGVSETKVEGVQKIIWGTHLLVPCPVSKQTSGVSPRFQRGKNVCRTSIHHATPHHRDHLRGCHAGALDVP